MENIHENEQFETAPEAEEEGYSPRPVWQVWAARVGLVLFIGLVVLQIANIARGGL